MFSSVRQNLSADTSVRVFWLRYSTHSFARFVKGETSAIRLSSARRHSSSLSSPMGARSWTAFTSIFSSFSFASAASGRRSWMRFLSSQSSVKFTRRASGEISEISLFESFSDFSFLSSLKNETSLTPQS